MEKICEKCGSPFTKKGHESTKQFITRRFCSRKCSSMTISRGGRKIENIIGRHFGRWQVVKFLGRNYGGHSSSWFCKCVCGKTGIIDSADLKRGHSKSCGCFRMEITSKRSKIHGLRKTRFYKIFAGIKSRCSDTNNKSFINYGGRGIKLLWPDFRSFYDDMYGSYQIHIKEFGEKQTTIDRIDVNGNYCRENCGWATLKEQMRNMRTNRFVEFQGEKRCLSEWAEIYGISQKLLQSRISRYNWPIEKALTQHVK